MTEENKYIGEDVSDSIKDFKDRRWSAWDNAWWWIRYGIWQWFEDRPRRAKSFLQRGWRGWADSDIWGFYYYLSVVIYEGLIQLKVKKHGYPSTLDPMTGHYDFDMKRWGGILDEMISGFDLVRKCANGDLQIGRYLTDAEKDNLNKKMQEDFPEWRLTTKEEDQKINRAFDLFKEYFFNLWD